MSMKTAILVDGAFFIKRYKRIMGSNVLDPIKTANDLFTMCLKHLEHSKGIKNNLYRIFYYDCEPYGKKQHHPLTGQSVDSPPPRF